MDISNFKSQICRSPCPGVDRIFGQPGGRQGQRRPDGSRRVWVYTRAEPMKLDYYNRRRGDARRITRFSVTADGVAARLRLILADPRARRRICWAVIAIGVVGI